MSIDRVFVDTNVLLSGLIFSGQESRLLQLGLDRKIRLVIADAVLDEARAVLAQKFPAHVGVLDAYLAAVDHERVPYPVQAAIDHVAGLLRDPADAVILASIVNASPDVAVTGDKDLLTADVRKVAPVRRCADYLRKAAKG